MYFRISLPALLALTITLTAQTPSPETLSALTAIRPSELKGDLSFLASDLLQGRYTPSPGLDIAAEFIASRFRAIGLDPAYQTSYFQMAEMIDRKLPRVITPLIGHDGAQTITVEPSKIHVTKASAPANIVNAPVLKISETTENIQDLRFDGKVVLVASAQSSKALTAAIAASKALLELIVTEPPVRNLNSRLLSLDDANSSAPPVVRVESPELAAALSTTSALTLSLDIPPPEDQKASLKNVIGVLPGSDPELKSTCVLITAHYDHIGTAETAQGLTLSQTGGEDHIFNGANDDGSGTVSVIEIARALAQLHPKRSVVFITFFGEERGLLGSTYYARHPLFPMPNTVADINLEQVGRTDSNAGPEIANASLTGYDYSSVIKYLGDAGKATGIKIYKDDQASDAFFVRSDNAALAEHGVPAHSLTTAFEYPDYHAVGDEWQKIDYDNMAKVDRTVALAVLNIANARKPPEWNADNPKTAPFREAREHPTSTP